MSIWNKLSNSTDYSPNSACAGGVLAVFQLGAALIYFFDFSKYVFGTNWVHMGDGGLLSTSFER